MSLVENHQHNKEFGFMSASFILQYFRVHLEPKAPLRMPAYNKGNVIRGGFGSTFRREGLKTVFVIVLVSKRPNGEEQNRGDCSHGRFRGDEE